MAQNTNGRQYTKKEIEVGQEIARQMLADQQRRPGKVQTYTITRGNTVEKIRASDVMVDGLGHLVVECREVVPVVDPKAPPGSKKITGGIVAIYAPHEWDHFHTEDAQIEQV